MRSNDRPDLLAVYQSLLLLYGLLPCGFIVPIKWLNVYVFILSSSQTRVFDVC